jgi:hypothetical protein
MFLSKFKASLKDNKPCSLGSLVGKARMMTRKKNEASLKIHGGTKRTLVPMKYFKMGTKMENKALNRIPMEGRLYHIMYDTLINKEG